MAKIANRVLSAAAAFLVAAWAGDAPATAAHANAADAADATGLAAPTTDALVALEKTAFEAWKSKDKAFWATFFSDKFVGYGSPGRLDKASAIKEYGNADCDIEGYTLSEEQVKPLGSDAALLTFKTVVDGTCGGQKVPVSWAAAVFVPDGDTWKSAFYGDTPVIDPKAAPATSAGPAKVVAATPAARDAGTAALLPVEKAVWEAWRVHDGRKLADLTASDISFINIFGTYLATKAEALKDWSATGCDVASVSLADAEATMLSPTVGILTFKAAADGTCYGQPVGPIWGTSVYVKDGATWKWTFGMNVPAPQP